MGKTFSKGWADQLIKRRDAAEKRRKIALKFHDRLVEMLTRPFQDGNCESFVEGLRAIASLQEAGFEPTADKIRERADETEALLAEIGEAENVT